MATARLLFLDCGPRYAGCHGRRSVGSSKDRKSHAPVSAICTAKRCVGAQGRPRDWIRKADRAPSYSASWPAICLRWHTSRSTAEACNRKSRRDRRGHALPRARHRCQPPLPRTHLDGPAKAAPGLDITSTCSIANEGSTAQTIISLGWPFDWPCDTTVTCPRHRSLLGASHPSTTCSGMAWLAWWKRPSYQREARRALYRRTHGERPRATVQSFKVSRTESLRSLGAAQAHIRCAMALLV